ncbi:phospholipase A-2-activating protein-like [Mya arenaria]|uniref:phospholipase A-2-activating protein-like n=1 Tax=Mya arenaria TaxID=6604 RepID=UPI0022E940BF|nr:phospholipase A-2-activating protein-like [Mya arenaria]XP_052777373.1 phospholipase A-2-activating protein-like [Mya arenaria]
MAAPYQLRCQIFGHSKDVRAVTPAIIPENAVVSGSRDATARVWVEEEDGKGYREGHFMSGHKNFVSSVCCMPPDDKYPHGLIFTGSNDNTILAFTLDSPQHIFQLAGHSGTVCSMAAGKFGTLLSGSWDKTAKVWLHQKCVMTLEGHQSAVWAVAIMPEQGVMLTGSADKTIKVWKAGKCENTITGHDDCVRGLAVTQGCEFLSCSNDATVRRWLVTGECIAVYYGHENFVYSLAVLQNGQDFVSSGEDRTVRVWKDGECRQTINHPCLSIWSLCVMANGDIVSGASDGILRVFTCDPARFASTEELKTYDEQIAQSQVPQDIRPEELPGLEALTKPGAKEGQTKMVRNAEGKVELYGWESGIQQWKKVGDVVGSSGGTTASSGKTLYEGKEYDYVFSVDIEEGKPPLKLPYNLTEDPWFAAQMFIEKNNLSQAFLDQVANFITENTKGATLTQGSGASYADPFTGGNRYVPGSSSSTSTEGADPFTGGGRYIPGGSSAPSAGGGGGGADPFTGGGRYVPSYNGEQTGTGGGGGGDVFVGAYTTGTVNPNLSKRNEFFPKETTLTFDAANPAQIMGKLREFNGTVEAGLKVDDKLIEGLEGLLHRDLPSEDNLNTLRALLLWPNNCVFPALDVLRITIKTQEVNVAFCVKDDILAAMMKFWTPENSVPNQVLSLKVVCNMFAQPQGFKLCMDNREKIVNSAIVIKDSKNKNVHIGLGTLILNFSVALFGSLDLEGKKKTLQAASECLKSKPDPEAAFRLFIAMGTLIHKDENIQKLAKSLGIANMLGDYLRVSEPAKISSCANFMQDLLR